MKCDLCKSEKDVQEFLDLCFMYEANEIHIFKQFEGLCTPCYDQIVSHIETNINLICRRLENGTTS